MIARTLICVMIAAAAVAATVAARCCAPSSSRRPRSDAVAVVFGNQRGRIEPCGCTSPQTGGVTRLAALIASVRSESPGAAAIQIGDPLSGAEGPVLAAAKLAVFDSFFDACRCGFAGGRPPSPPPASTAVDGVGWSPVSVPGGSIAVWNYVVRCRSDVGALERSLARRPQEVRANALLVAVDADSENVSSLVQAIESAATAVPAVVLDLRSGLREANSVRAPPGRATVIALPDRGRDAVVLRRGSDEDSAALRCVTVALAPELDSVDGPQVAAVRASLTSYGEALDRGRAIDELPRVSDGEGARFRGSTACAGCHPGQYAGWSVTRHAHALATLTRRGRAADPECVVCHTVGWRRTSDGSWIGSESGFAAPGAAADVADVGCESCHGAGQAHVGAPPPRGASPSRSWIARPTSDQCVACHDSESSPGFRERFESADLHSAAHDVPPPAR